MTLQDSTKYRIAPQKESSFHQQIGLKFKEETSKVLHLEQSFVWCRNLGTSETTLEMLEKF
jgi:hypothetical protein